MRLVGCFGCFVGRVKGTKMVGRSRRRSIPGGAQVHVIVPIPSSVADVEEAPPDYAHAPGQQDQPDGGDQDGAAPGQEQLQDVDGGAAEKDGGWDGVGHGGMVQLGEAERRLAQLAVLLLRVGQPLHEAFLVDVFDAAAALAGIEERFLGGALTPTDTTCIGIVLVLLVGGGQGAVVVQARRVGVQCRSHVRPGGLAGVWTRGRVGVWAYAMRRAAGVGVGVVPQRGSMSASEGLVGDCRGVASGGGCGCGCEKRLPRDGRV